MEESTSITSFFAAWEIFQDATLAGTLAGALLGFLGVYVVLRRMVFLSAALSQAAGLGVTLAFYAQIYWGVHAALGSAALGAAVVTLLAVFGVMQAKGSVANRDSLLGFTYLLGSAGALVIGTRILQELQDIETILFGSAVAVLPREFTLIAVMTGLLLVLHGLCLRGFMLVSFDPGGRAHSRPAGAPLGWPAAWLFGHCHLGVHARAGRPTGVCLQRVTRHGGFALGRQRAARLSPRRALWGGQRFWWLCAGFLRQATGGRLADFGGRRRGGLGRRFGATPRPRVSRVANLAQIHHAGGGTRSRSALRATRALRPR